MPLIDYSKDDDEALGRARQHEFHDPLVSVPRALLSSAEIDDYVRVTGLLYPFYPANLKSASYEAHIGGDVIWWDEKGKKHKREVSLGERLTLPASSIVFVQVEPVFRLPYYIAIRFNLRITHVHRGLLLGTGPLVDPGFCGKLLIPLHNLTSSDYDLDTSKALIWIEFTKTSYGTCPIEDVANQDRMNVRFPESKRGMSADQYLLKANDGNPIRSSISDALTDARLSAGAAKKQVVTLTQIGIIAILAAIIGLYQIYLQVGSMTQGAQQLVSSVQQTIAPAGGDAKAALEKIANTQLQIDRLNQQIEQLRNDLALAIKKRKP
jgi:deoxycytidine triphosphate deaminase